MSDFSRVMEKHANTGKWREIHEGWIGNKRTQFPCQLALPYPQKRRIKQNTTESSVNIYILFLDGQKVVKINPESEIKHSWDIDGMY